MPAINGRLIQMHGFTPSEILMEYVPEWKIESSKHKKVASNKTLIIDKPMVAQWVEQQTEWKKAIILAIAENQTISEAKVQWRWTRPIVEDLMLIKDFKWDKHYGKKLDSRWISPRLLVEITSSDQAGYVQGLYGEQSRKYHLDNLKVYCLKSGLFSTATVLHQSAMTHAKFLSQ